MGKSFWLFFFLLPLISFSQSFTGEQERFPVFSECADVSYENEESCFTLTLQKKIIENFQLPEKVREDNYKGQVVVLFEVKRDGSFSIIYMDAAYSELKEEMKEVFRSLPQVRPATFDQRPVNMQFRMPVRIPLDATRANSLETQIEVLPRPEQDLRSPVTEEYDQIKSLPVSNPRVNSDINIPLSHEFYSRFDAAVNRVGTNFHGASKPFLFEEVQPYYDFELENQKLYKNVSSWFGRKLWNEHLIAFQGEDYWFTVDFGVDLQVGKDFDSNLDVTYNNTRAAILQGGLGDDLNFYSVVYENQGRFADYYNRYAESLRPYGADPAIIPGRGIAKEFMGQAYDYPVAEGYLSYSPGKFLNLQFGHGKNFIGEGYRSLFLSDNATPHPYFRLNTTFWKLKYTNLWMSLRDVRPEVEAGGAFRTKYMASHYLSYNVTKRLNLGFFESVIWDNSNDRGIDLNYINPVIFYRAIEFSTGPRAGNAIMGLAARYKWSDRFNMYSQWLIDEFSSADIFGGEGSWKNKLGFQLGAKYFDAFSIPELFLQLEYNQVRPYTYSHNTITLNYGHNNQSMAHQWGANFRELIGIARYRYERYYGHLKLIYGERGYDFNTPEDDAYYGGDIYRSERQRALDSGVRIGQGNTVNSFYAETEVGYIVNPVTNLKFFGSFIYRNFESQMNTPATFNNTTYWLNIGLRTDIFNWYFDY